MDKFFAVKTLRPNKNRRTLYQARSRKKRSRNVTVWVGGVVALAALALAALLLDNAWLDGLVRRSTFVTEDAARLVREAPHNWKIASLENATLRDTEPHTGRITFVCDMSYEMGNILSHLAYCLTLALWMERDHGVMSNLVLRHNGKEGTGWESSRDDILACFPRLSGADFSLARTQAFVDEFELRTAEQERDGLNLTGINRGNLSRVEEYLVEVARRAKAGGIRPAAPNGSITLPFLAAKRMLSRREGSLLDRYYDEIRDLFAFDDSDGSCCALRPDPDETVFVRVVNGYSRSASFHFAVSHAPWTLSNSTFAYWKRCSTFATLRQRSSPMKWSGWASRSSVRDRPRTTCLATCEKATRLPWCPASRTTR
jgi:hypothetical protein